MVLKLSLEEGVEKVFELGKKIKLKPIVVSIHGYVNCGKTHILRLLINDAHRRGFAVTGGQCDDTWAYEKNSDYIFVEDAIYTAQAEHYARRIIGKGVDMRILIDNPKIKRLAPLVQEDISNNKYDIMINNPDSRIKGSPYR